MLHGGRLALIAGTQGLAFLDVVLAYDCISHLGCLLSTPCLPFLYLSFSVLVSVPRPQPESGGS